MQQYKRDQLYLPTASPNDRRQTSAADYQSYKKESAFRRLVSGALRIPTERHRRQPSSNEYDSKRQTIAAYVPRPQNNPYNSTDDSTSSRPPPEPNFGRTPEEDRQRRRRSHRKSTYSEAPRRPPAEEYDYRRPADDRRYSRQSMRRPELKPLSSHPVSGIDTSSYAPVTSRAGNRATIDARRPYTTERLSRHSSHHPRRRE